jgi:hypothetical protein
MEKFCSIRFQHRHRHQGWKLLGDGADWTGAGRRAAADAEKEFIRALAGDRDWTDYTLTLKARKISGAEGFLICSTSMATTNAPGGTSAAGATRRTALRPADAGFQAQPH